MNSQWLRQRLAHDKFVQVQVTAVKIISSYLSEKASIEQAKDGNDMIV